MFVLTAEEKRVVCFVMLAILIGLGVKEYRRTHPAIHPPNSVLKESAKNRPVSAKHPPSPPEQRNYGGKLLKNAKPPENKVWNTTPRHFAMAWQAACVRPNFARSA